MMVVFVVDLEHFLILDKVVLPAVFVVVVFNVLSDWVSGGSIFMFSSMTIGGLFSAVFLSGLSFLLWWVSDGRLIGFGDVKFLFLMGLILGFPLGFLGFFGQGMFSVSDENVESEDVSKSTTLDSRENTQYMESSNNQGQVEAYY
jgi:Flp pilus assembly protein protease CpaA